MITPIGVELGAMPSINYHGKIERIGDLNFLFFVLEFSDLVGDVLYCSSFPWKARGTHRPGVLGKSHRRMPITDVQQWAATT